MLFFFFCHFILNMFGFLTVGHTKLYKDVTSGHTCQYWDLKIQEIPITLTTVHISLTFRQGHTQASTKSVLASSYIK